MYNIVTVMYTRLYYCHKILSTFSGPKTFMCETKLKMTYFSLVRTFIGLGSILIFNLKLSFRLKRKRFICYIFRRILIKETECIIPHDTTRKHRTTNDVTWTTTKTLQLLQTSLHHCCAQLSSIVFNHYTLKRRLSNSLYKDNQRTLLNIHFFHSIFLYKNISKFSIDTICFIPNEKC